MVRRLRRETGVTKSKEMTVRQEGDLGRNLPMQGPIARAEDPKDLSIYLKGAKERENSPPS